MKKLFFMFVLLVGFGLSVQAQTKFYDDDTAISFLKEELADLSVVRAHILDPVGVDQQSMEAGLLRKATIRGARNLVDLISDQGNSQASLDRAFEDSYFNQQYMTPAIVAAAKENVRNLVSSDE